MMIQVHGPADAPISMTYERYCAHDGPWVTDVVTWSSQVSKVVHAFRLVFAESVFFGIATVSVFGHVAYAE